MRKCTFCGNTNFDTDKICERCNAPLPTSVPYTAPQPSYQQQQVSAPVYYNMQRRQSGLTIATKVIMILNTALYWIGFFSTLVLWAISLITAVDEFVILMLGCMILSLIYAIVALIITKSYFEKERSGNHISIGFKLAAFLVFGLLLLIFMVLDNN